MAKWLYEAGIGENRAIRIEKGVIAEAAIEIPGVIAVRSIRRAKLVTILVPEGRGIARLEAGGEVLIEPLPSAVTEGASVRIEIVREAIPEAGRQKLPKGRIVEADGIEQPGPGLHDRLIAAGHQIVQHARTGIDLFEEAGWSELLEEALTGAIPFEGGSLRMSVTPAMTLFDVDGALPAFPLAVAGAAAAVRSILRFGIAGSIGIDLPTLREKGERQAAAAEIDRTLPQPFERTAVNGFGFLQIVRRRERCSLPELLAADRACAAARALLRRAERSPGAGEQTLIGAPGVIAQIERRPEWLATLARRTGAAVVLRAEAGLAISASHVHTQFA